MEEGAPAGSYSICPISRNVGTHDSESKSDSAIEPGHGPAGNPGQCTPERLARFN